MLLPQLIRDKFPKISIGFFLHIPFPSYELFRILPWRAALLKGVLGSDLIGFHTFDYMRHFLSAVYRILGVEHDFGTLMHNNPIVNVDVFPMGINYEKYAFPDLTGADQSLLKRIAKRDSDEKVIISIDRLDYTKGIPQRIKAFEKLLDDYPEYRGRVTLVLVVVPSRSNVTQYKQLKEEIDTLVGRIDGQYSTFDWTPIQYLYRSLPFKDLAALYKISDIALITPLRDGMNLVAKEFVAAKQDNKGVLILSEMAGAATQLRDALLINPQDRKEIVEALRTAIEMPLEEQKERLKALQEVIQQYDVKHWANTFIKEQMEVSRSQVDTRTKLLKGESREQLLEAYKNAKKRLILLDYDGTLMGFKVDPTEVKPDPTLMNLLTMLKDDSKNKLVVISGRDKDTLGQWMKPLGIDLSCEHGVWRKFGDQWTLAEGLFDSWKDKVRPVLENLVNRTPGSFIEEKDYSLAWHYRKIDTGLGEKRVREFKDVILYLTANLDLQVLEGNKVLEIKNAGVNKGKAASQWLSLDQWDFILAIGDDQTDEDIFKVVPKNVGYTIKVGLDHSEATYSLLGVEEVRLLLEDLTK